MSSWVILDPAQQCLSAGLSHNNWCCACIKVADATASSLPLQTSSFTIQMDHHLLDLPPKILSIIISNLEYASEVNNLAQTCRQLSYFANAILYSYWAKKCSPAGIRRIVINENIDALRKFSSSGLTHQEYSDVGRWTPLALACARGCTEGVRTLLEVYGSQIIPATDGKIYSYDTLNPVFSAATNGHLEALMLGDMIILTI